MRSFACAFVFLALGCGGATVGISNGSGTDDAGVDSGTASKDAASSSLDSGSNGVCTGQQVMCLHGCGSDWIAQAECHGGTWECPAGTVDQSTCPTGACGGPPLPGEVCGPGGWQCAPTASALQTCASTMCAECPTTPIGASNGCQCQCDANGAYVCSKLPVGCCQADADCGDFAYVPCVNGVCTAPLTNGGCWNDVQCGSGKRCDGAIVCACNARCAAPDRPGTCVSL